MAGSSIGLAGWAMGLGASCFLVRLGRIIPLSVDKVADCLAGFAGQVMFLAVFRVLLCGISCAGRIIPLSVDKVADSSSSLGRWAFGCRLAFCW